MVDRSFIQLDPDHHYLLARCPLGTATAHGVGIPTKMYVTHIGTLAAAGEVVMDGHGKNHRLLLWMLCDLDFCPYFKDIWYVRDFVVI